MATVTPIDRQQPQAPSRGWASHGLTSVRIAAARIIATLASLVLLACSLRYFPSRDVVTLQGALAAAAIAGLIAESGIGVETTRLAARSYSRKASARLLTYRGLLLVPVILVTCGIYLLVDSNPLLLYSCCSLHWPSRYRFEGTLWHSYEANTWAASI